jgi:hypothetical protein
LASSRRSFLKSTAIATAGVAIDDDNYVTLMPGERRTLHAEVNHADTRGEGPRMVVEGFNVKAI